MRARKIYGIFLEVSKSSKIQCFLALSLQMKFITSKENTSTKLSRPLPKTDMLNLDF